MLKHYMLLILISLHLLAQCAEQPEFTLDHAAMCRHQMAYNPENWNVISACIAANLFKRYPDITKKELVGLFRWADEKGNQRSSVLPLPILQKIWHYIEISELSDVIFQFNDGFMSAFSDKLLSAYIPNDITRRSLEIYHNYRQRSAARTGLMQYIFGKKVEIAITYRPLSLIRQNIGGIDISEPSQKTDTDIRSYAFWEQNYAHLIFTTNRYVLAVTYVPYDANATLSPISWTTNKVKRAYAEGYARCFSTLHDALEWILSLPQR